MVNVEAEIAGEKFQIDNFFEFSIAQSIIEIWQAGGKELAFMMMIFSGIWPYTKLLMTMILWFMSPSSLSISRRGSVLLWLDFLGKWSMIDIFVLVISIAAFRVSIQSPNTSYLPEDFYSIEMMVIPLWCVLR
jgi:Paraquat-inducible protein A